MTSANSRFKFLADALDASGGFAPVVEFAEDRNKLLKPARVVGPCHITPYPRESAKKFAARVAEAVYENHLASACARFVGYLAKRAPLRTGADTPLAAKFVADVDMRGNAIDIFWQSFAVQAKARGTMLVLIDAPSQEAIDAAGNAAAQAENRLLPYLTMIAPERIEGFALTDRGAFDWVEISAKHTIDGKQIDVVRRWDQTSWSVRRGDTILGGGKHRFGECPMLIFTEGGQFPHVGVFEQIAAMSRRLYNARSERDEILRGQTFSVLAYQVEAQQISSFSGAKIAEELGTNNMLIYAGERPEFIAPPDGPAATYAEAIAAAEETIRRVSMNVDEVDKATAESGVSRAIRFEALNSSLSAFARRLEDTERRVWALFAHWANTAAPSVQWPKDFSLADVVRELDILTAMQSTGFPPEVLRAKRKQIVAADMPTLEDDERDMLLNAIDEAIAEVPPVPPVPPDPTDPTDPTAAQ